MAELINCQSSQEEIFIKAKTDMKVRFDAINDKEIKWGVVEYLKNDKHPEFPPDIEAIEKIIMRRLGRI